MRKHLFIDCGTLLLTTSTGALFLVDCLVPKMLHMSCDAPFTFPFVFNAGFSDMSALSQAIFSWRLIPIQPFIPPSKEWSNYLLCPVQCVHPFFWHFLSHYHGGTLYTWVVPKVVPSIARGRLCVLACFPCFSILHCQTVHPYDRHQVMSAHIVLSTRSLLWTDICIILKLHTSWKVNWVVCNLNI